MDLTRQLRREAARIGIPLSFVLQKSQISRFSFYAWDSGTSTPCAGSINRLLKALEKTRRLEEFLSEI